MHDDGLQAVPIERAQGWSRDACVAPPSGRGDTSLSPDAKAEVMRRVRNLEVRDASPAGELYNFTLQPRPGTELVIDGAHVAYYEQLLAARARDESDGRSPPRASDAPDKSRDADEPTEDTKKKKPGKCTVL